MNLFECSIWQNNGFRGLTILGGPDQVRKVFRRAEKTVTVIFDGRREEFNIDKNSFWAGCPHLIKEAAIRPWVLEHHLRPADRVWLEVVEPFKIFRAIVTTDLT